MKILVTGSAGFIARHLVTGARARPDVDEVIEIHRGNWGRELEPGLARADVVVHLAGANRPQDPADFEKVNLGLTRELCLAADRLGRRPVIVMSSSIQALQDNPYGRSKKAAEEWLQDWAVRAPGRAVVFRIKNVFGPGCRPHYNSVTATFCHNVAHGRPLTISDPNRMLELVHIGDVVTTLLGCLDESHAAGFELREIGPVHRIALGDLADRISSFRDRPETAVAADDGGLMSLLHQTFLGYVNAPATSAGRTPFSP